MLRNYKPQLIFTGSYKKKVYSFLGDQGNNMYLFNNKNIQSRVNTCILTSQITDIFKRINQLKCQVTDKSDETGRMCQVTDIFGHSHRCSVLTYILGEGVYFEFFEIVITNFCFRCRGSFLDI